jgi:predicted transcriptional regulator
MVMRKVIQNEAERVSKEAGFTVLPICPFKIAADEGISVQAKPAEVAGVSGMLMRSGDDFGILYATNISSEGFQRFSVSHELGHYFLEGHAEAVLKMGAHLSRAGFDSDDRYEREADLFAASLLMPEGAFRNAMRSAGSGMEAVERLASSAQTSLTATAFRFQELTRDALAVIQATDGLIDVCFYSDRFKGLGKLPFLKRGTPLPHGTITSQFHRDKTSILRGEGAEERTAFADWFGIDGVEVREQVKGLGSYGKTLTILSSEVKSEDDFDPHDEADDEEYLKEHWTPRFL